MKSKPAKKSAAAASLDNDEMTRHVLIVEDSKTLSGILKKTFLANGYKADAALTTRKATEAFAKIAYDLAVINYHLPDGKGNQLLADFRKARPDCVCIMMTNDPKPALTLSWLKKGAAACLCKPFEPAYLIELCARALRERKILRTHELMETRIRELTESELKYRTLIEYSSDVIFCVDKDGYYKFVNNVFASTLEKTPEYFEGKSFWDIYPKEQADQRYEAIKKVFQTGEVGSIDVVVQLPDRTLYYLAKVNPVKDPQGNVIMVLTHSTDITERKRTEDALKESETKFRTIFESFEDIYYQTNLKGIITMISPSVYRLSGWKPEELIGQNVTIVYDAHDDRMALLKAISEQGYVRDYELTLTMRDGSKAMASLSAHLLYDANGKVTGLAGSLRNITDRNKAEMALKESEEKFRVLTGSSPTAIMVYQGNKWIYANPAAEEITGYTGEEFLSMNFWDIVHPDDKQMVQERGQKRQRGEAVTKRYKFRIVSKDDTVKWVDLSGEKIVIGGSPAGIISVLDITESKRAEEALRQSEERYRTILESIDEGYFEVNLAGNLSFFNDSLCKILAYSKEELLDMNYRQYTDKENAKKLFQAFNEIYRTEKPILGFNWQIIKKDGTDRQIEADITLLKDSAGNKIGFRGIGHDVTDRKSAEKNLRESEEKYRTILESIDEGYFEVDLAGNLSFFNNSLCKMFGYPKEELLGMNNRQYTNAENAKKLFQAFNEVYRTENPTLGFDWQIIKKDGTCRQIEASVALRKDSAGKKIGFRGTVRDVTDRKQAEDALRQSEERYRTILEEMEEGYQEVDLAGNITFINEAILKIYGYDRNELLGKNYSRFTANEEDVKKLYRVHNHMYKTGIPVRNFEMNINRKDGNIRTLEIYASLLMDPNNRPIGFRGIIRDITDRKLAQEALRQSEERYRTILEEMEEGYQEVDLAGKMTFINDAFLRICGFSREELIGTDYTMYTEPEEAEMIYRSYNQMYKTGIPIRALETNILIKDGTRKIIEIHASLLRDYNNHPTGFRGIIRDITDRKRAEEERKKLQAQVNQSQKMESVGRLAGGVAHDFNNMLGVILGRAEIGMRKTDPAQPLYQDLLEIRKAAERSADLTRQLLAFARKQTVAPKILDINEVVEGLLKMLRRLIGEDIDLIWLPGKKILSLKMDPSQIDQLLINLCINARDAIAGVGKVTIETGTTVIDEAYCVDHTGFLPGEYVLLTVSDDGSGMEKEILDNLFEPFFTTKDIGEGTGLGLATVYGIVKQNNGFINVYSEPGHGTTFRIYLPRHLGKTESITTRAPKAPAEHGHETILLVEDEPTILELSQMMLESLGYKVIAASRPGEAIHLARNHAGEIHLLMTDVVMPEMNGRDLAKNILSLYPDIKRLFMSGYTANVIAHRGVLDEGVHFLQKPFSLNSLAAKLREVLET